jgi:hypothetical protein
VKKKTEKKKTRLANGKKRGHESNQNLRKKIKKTLIIIN